MWSSIDIEKINAIAKSAGELIMEVYEKDFSVDYKDDKSPLTEADSVANTYICKELQVITPDIPILSEENKAVPYEKRKDWKCFWLVDPLDGTKEFIKKNGEFTVNIALIENGKPVMGVVYAPALNLLYFTKQGEGAFRIDESGNNDRLPIGANESGKIRVVASRSHMSDETKEYIENLKTDNKEVELVSKGSSLKICLVAEGSADVYPRLGPTMEWDTGAAHAIVNYAKGEIVQYGNNLPLVYNKENLVNPWFVVKGSLDQ